MPKRIRYKSVDLIHYGYWLGRWELYQETANIIIPTETDLQRFSLIHELGLEQRTTLFKLLESTTC